MALQAKDIEEQYILRVEDESLAERIRTALRSDQDEGPSNSLQISFEGGDGVHGKLLFDGDAYQLTVMNLPCVTESYKTYDDINLVKTTDIGQALIVGKKLDPQEEQGGILKDGITPPMRNARERVFKKPLLVAPQAVHRVEEQMLIILHGGAPNGYKFVDHEEVWEVDPATGRGRWVPVKK